MSGLGEKNKTSFSVWQALEVLSLFVWWSFIFLNIARLGGFSFLGGDLGDIAAVATVVALFINIWVIRQTQQELKLDREERQEARDFQAWSNITNPDIPGPNKMDDLEYLHKKGRSFAGLPLPEGTQLVRTAEQAQRLGKGIYLNLPGADLRGVDWKGVKLDGANLQGADLWGANLQEATLTEANLKETKMVMANLENASLFCADLAGAFLTGSNLKNADITSAEMKFVRHVSQKQIARAFYERAFKFGPPELPEGIEPPPERKVKK